MATNTSKVRAARSEYNEIKKLYHRIGKKVMGTPKSAAIRKDYGHVKKAYHQAGKALAKLTKKKSRRGG